MFYQMLKNKLGIRNVTSVLTVSSLGKTGFKYYKLHLNSGRYQPYHIECFDINSQALEIVIICMHLRIKVN